MLLQPGWHFLQIKSFKSWDPIKDDKCMFGVRKISNATAEQQNWTLIQCKCESSLQSGVRFCRVGHVTITYLRWYYLYILGMH